jgi:hypothetical protein
MGEVVPFRSEPRDGQLTRVKPERAISLEAGCDWGWCDRPGVAWRYSAGLKLWLVVCAGCLARPPKEQPSR